jgi:uncharacterized membrane protein (UPF0182 family)
VKRSPPNWFDYPGVRKKVISLVIILGVLLAVLLYVLDFLVNWLWFDSLGYLPVYLITLGAQTMAAVLGGAFFLLLALPNLYLAQRLSRDRPRPGWSSLNLPPEAQAGLQNILKIALWVGLGFFIYLAGMLAAREWQTILMFWQGQAFGIREPIFQQDIAFYLFSLPFYRKLAGALWLAGLGVTLLTITKYVQNDAVIFSPETRRFYMVPGVKRHLDRSNSRLKYLSHRASELPGKTE